MKNKIGILLSNIGTPDAPSPKAVRRYLKEFLSDSRVVEAPALIWQPILYTCILPFRSKASAKLYQKIWTPEGSPLLHYSRNIAIQLEKKLRDQFHSEIYVAVGMRYGNPSIKSALQQFREAGVNSLVVLPMYPQYSATTSASTWDAVADTFKKWRHIPDVRTIMSYADNSAYIQAVSQSIQDYWQAHGKKFLLFSFHGIPQYYADAGDPYAKQCQLSAELIAKYLKLASSEWALSFQSRLGPTKWLGPYTDETLRLLPSKGVRELQVVCPGFAVDCLETLEEIAIRGREQFAEGGGKVFEYIPALNDSQSQVDMLKKLVAPYI